MMDRKPGSGHEGVAGRWPWVALVASPAIALCILACGSRAGSSPVTEGGSFAATGSMATVRSGGSATALSDGRVLIAAGVAIEGGMTTELPEAELYDSKSGTFSSTGPMNVSRSVHSATRLADGRVLVAGGVNFRNGDFTSLASAELYDPATGVFTPTGSMSASRGFSTSTLLADGRVLVAGGAKIDGGTRTSLASAELYDPETGAFTPTGTMTVPRQLATASLLTDGRVLIVGGSDIDQDSTTTLSSAELYDPALGSFSLSRFVDRSRRRSLGDPAWGWPSAGDGRWRTGERRDDRDRDRRAVRPWDRQTFSLTGSLRTPSDVPHRDQTRRWSCSHRGGLQDGGWRTHEPRVRRGLRSR